MVVLCPDCYYAHRRNSLGMRLGKANINLFFLWEQKNLDWKNDATHTPDILDVNSILYVHVCVVCVGVGELTLQSHLMYKNIKFQHSHWKHCSVNTQITVTH